MFAALLALSRVEAIKKIQAARDVPPMLKVAIAGGLAMMTDADYGRYGRLVSEALAVLSESERGRALLNEIGIEPVAIPA